MRLNLITKNRKMSKNIYINKKARYDYFFIEEVNAGIVLTGNEVKSLTNGSFVAGDSYVYFDGNVPMLSNLVISKYSRQHPSSTHDENRPKALLLTSNQIKRLKKESSMKGITLILTNIHFENNRIKIGLALAKGKKDIDKRNVIKERDVMRDVMRSL